MVKFQDYVNLCILFLLGNRYFKQINVKIVYKNSTENSKNEWLLLLAYFGHVGAVDNLIFLIKISNLFNTSILSGLVVVI